MKKNYNWAIALIGIMSAILLVLGVFTFYTKSQANNDLSVLIKNNKFTSDINNKYVNDYTKTEKELTAEIDSTFNPIELRKISDKINTININTLKDYETEINNIKQEFSQSLDAWSKGITADANFDNKAKLLEELEKLKTGVNNISNPEQFELQKNNFVNLQTTYNVQLETYNKKSFIGGIQNAKGEINGLIEYLSKYPSLSSELAGVIKYKNETDSLASDSELAKYKYQDLENKVNSEFRPLLAAGFKARSDNEEAIRIKLVTIQAKTQGTITSAPIATGKAVLVLKSEQKMYIYENGNLLRTTPVTTGRTNWPTDPGTYSILTKERNRRLQGSGQGATWNVFVNYWMLFNAAEEEGIHDAPWRNGNFGGPDYVTNGSRGCVNTPDDIIAWLFDWAYVGMPVIIRD